MRIPSLTVELVYANIVTVLGIAGALFMEGLLEGARFRAPTKAFIVLLFATAVLSYTAFSLKTPMTFFTTPEGF